MATITFKVDDDLKKDAVELYKRMGLDLSSALRLFMTQSVNLRKIPFEVKDREDDFDSMIGNMPIYVRSREFSEYNKETQEALVKNMTTISQQGLNPETRPFAEVWEEMTADDSEV